MFTSVCQMMKEAINTFQKVSVSNSPFFFFSLMVTSIPIYIYI